MTHFLAISSSKGGVGKTTVALALGIALRNFGRDTALIDANLSTPAVALHLGFQPNHSLHHLLKDNIDLDTATYQHPSGLKIVPGCYKLESCKSYNVKEMNKVLENLDGYSEIVLFDTPGTLTKETLQLLSDIGEQIVVTEPNIVSVTEALRTINLGEEHGVTCLGIVVNKDKKDSKSMNSKEIEDFLGKPVIGVIPFDDSISNAFYQKQPVNYIFPNSPSSIAFSKLASELIGDRYEEQLHFGNKNRNYMEKVKDIFVKDILGLK